MPSHRNSVAELSRIVGVKDMVLIVQASFLPGVRVVAVALSLAAEGVERGPMDEMKFVACHFGQA